MAGLAVGPGLLDQSLVYNPVTNPNGARCTVAEMRVNIYGRDPETGFALGTEDNVGVQYGLAALNRGQISVSQFLDLNEQVGGFDVDGNIVAERTVASRLALREYHPLRATAVGREEPRLAHRARLVRGDAADAGWLRYIDAAGF